jgi:hypothetical protein
VAILALLFASTIAILHHHDPHSSSVCRICYLIHLPLLSERVCVQLPPFGEATGEAPVVNDSPGIDRVTDHSSPRAPPVA